MKRREAEEKMVWPNLKEKPALVPTEPGTSSMALLHGIYLSYILISLSLPLYSVLLESFDSQPQPSKPCHSVWKWTLTTSVKSQLVLDILPQFPRRAQHSWPFLFASMRLLPRKEEPNEGSYRGRKRQLYLRQIVCLSFSLSHTQ